ncbi:MAG: protein translocase subunit SecF [Candidatus Aenigmarchaeota archaeon]|nr:protein translocase subunit SecF [Candidatus Aenigmarchaeota archaeon]
MKGLPFNYRLLLVIPMIVLLVSLGIMVNQYNQTGEWFQRSIELKGGTVLTVSTDEPLEIKLIESDLQPKFPSLTVRETRSFEGYGTLIEMDSETDVDAVLGELESIGVDISDHSIENVGSSLGSSFWIQAQLGLIIAFIFMGIIVFVIFRSLIPSLAVIASAVSDILITLGMMQFFGIQLSLAGFAALLMLIGYSVDTDIMLTSRLLRESDEKEIDVKLRKAVKTGLTMTLTTVGALLALLLSSISVVLSQIAIVLLIGLVFDIMNTWLMNSVMLKWYVERKGI